MMLITREFLRRRCVRWAAGLALVAVAPTASRAAYTPIKPPGAFEDSHEAILENVYGGDFAPSDKDFSNGAVTARRIDDSLDDNGILGLVDGRPGSAADQIWHDGFTTAEARARFAKLQQSFGFWEGEEGGTYENLFDVTGSGYAVTGSASLRDMRGLIWRWGRDRGGTGTHSSLPSENPDGLDHLTTYRIDGLADGALVTTWLLFWEDRNIGIEGQRRSDRDHNDLVVEVKAVPEPSLAGLAAALLGARLLGRRRRQ